MPRRIHNAAFSFSALGSALVLTAAMAGNAAQAGPCQPLTSPVDNTCVGTGTLDSNTTGNANTAVGTNALTSNTVGAGNTAIGVSALFNNITGENNTASGSNALALNTSGVNNTSTGGEALRSNTTGSFNTAAGAYALYFSTTGAHNTANGSYALHRTSTGDNNTAVGHNAMISNTTGSSNAAFGFGAGNAWTTGSNNIAIGNAGVAGESHTIRIGASQTTPFVAGIYNTRVTKARTVLVNANGQLGSSRSSIRYKEDVHTMGDASSPLMNLRPVTFRYKEAESDGSKPIQYGLIAEEVEKVMPDLVIYNAQGTPESVAYETLPSLLLNEYQKQGRELAAAKAELAETKARFESMASELAALKLAVSRLAAAPRSSSLAALDSLPAKH